MDAVATVVLGATVGAWEGRARHQRAAGAEADLLFTGGGWQLAVPDLTWREIATSRIGTAAGSGT
jgi:hypothetical protein